MFKRLFGEIKKLELSEKLLLALVFVLPFERIPSFEFGGLTLKLSLLVGLALIAVVSFENLKSDGKKHKLSAPLIMPGLLLLYSLLTVFWAGDKPDWLKANLVLGFMVILFYECYRVVTESKSRDKLVELILKTVLISAGAIISFGLFQWFGDLLGLSRHLTAIRPEYTADKLGLPRMHSVLLEPLYFGLYLLLPLGIIWADRTGRIVKTLSLRFGLISLIYLVILLSLARGAIVASAVVGVLGLIYNFSELKKSLKLRDLVKVAVSGLLLVILLFISTSLLGKKGTDEDHNYKKGFYTITGHLETIKPWGNKEDAKEQNSINSRDVARSDAWRVVTESKGNFLFGVGAGQYGKSSEATSNFVFLDVWVEYGLVGVLTLAAFFISVFVEVLKNRRGALLTEKVVIVGVAFYLVGFLIQSITFGEFTITHLWVMLALVLGVVNNQYQSS